jgi:hypothetical protein
MHDLTKLRIEYAAATLRRAGALDVDAYELKLRRNAPNVTQVTNHLSEARVALMFIENRDRVTMRDSPDLEIEWLGVKFYAEVKHFNRKEHDEIDEAAMRRAPGEVLIVGDTARLEGRSSYQQMSDVARKKKRQYVDGAINILVIDSSSESMLPAEAMARSAVKEYDEELCKTPHDVALRRLYGIMLITSWGSVGWNSRNVGFEMTWYALPHPQMTWKLIESFKGIGRG